MKRTKEVATIGDFIKISEVYPNFKFSTPELKVLEESFKNKTFLGDGVIYNTMIQMKKDFYELMALIDVDYVYPELGERNNYRVTQYDSSLPFDCEFELHRDLTKRQAFVIARHLNNKKYEYECKYDCDTGVDYLVYYINEYGERIDVDYLRY